MVALVDHEGIGADVGGVELIGTEQPEQVNAAEHHLVHGLAAGKTEIQCTDAAGRGVQHVEAVPFRGQHARLRRELPTGGQRRSTVRTAQGALPHDDHRLLRIRQRGREGVRSIEQAREVSGGGADLLHRIGEIGDSADRRHREAAGQKTLANARVDQRRFMARVGADDQQRVGLFDPGD